MLSLVLVPLHDKYWHIHPSSLFQIWESVQATDAEDDSMADGRGYNILFVYHCRVPRRPPHFRIDVQPAQKEVAA